jgi:hypothetical protein
MPAPQARRKMSAGDGPLGLSAPVHVPSVGDSGDDHQAHLLVERKHDPVVADSDPIVLAAGQLDCVRRPRVMRQGVDRGRDSFLQLAVGAAIGRGRLGVEANLVGTFALAGYSRTAAQGTAVSRSSRAWRTARLSSRNSSRSISSP